MGHPQKGPKFSNSRYQHLCNLKSSPQSFRNQLSNSQSLMCMILTAVLTVEEYSQIVSILKDRDVEHVVNARHQLKDMKLKSQKARRKPRLMYKKSLQNQKFAGQLWHKFKPEPGPEIRCQMKSKISKISHVKKALKEQNNTEIEHQRKTYHLLNKVCSANKIRQWNQLAVHHRSLCPNSNSRFHSLKARIAKMKVKYQFHSIANSQRWKPYLKKIKQLFIKSKCQFKLVKFKEISDCI